MRSDIVLTSLREQIQSSNLELLETLVGEFRCAGDKDVESFLQSKAIRYERSGLSRTYIYIAGSDAEPEVAAYFTIAVTSVDYQGISRNMRQKVLGGTPGRDNQDHFGGLLIAQLGRCDSFTKSDINGSEMMEDCEEIIEETRDIIGGRAIYLDCHEELIKFYSSFGYALLKQEPFANGLYKMVRIPPKL
jgi:hypothetical protein